VSSCYPVHAPAFPPVATLPLLTWIGNAAAALLGRRGAVTRQAQQAGCSRQTVYHHAAKAQDALRQAQAPGPDRGALLREVQQLRQGNRQLWDWLAEALDCPKDKQRQFAVTATAMGLSLQQARSLLAILLPPARCPSRATLGRWVQAAARRAGAVLAVLDRACRGLTRCLALDEIFVRRRPVLTAVEPHSLAWLLGARAADRTGGTWAEALAAWPQVEDAVADGGSGLASGLLLAAQRRAAAGGGAAAPLRVRRDVSHTRRDGGRALRRAWQQAEARWAAAEAAERDRARAGRRGADRRGFNRRLAVRRRRATAAFEEAQRQERAWRRAAAALGVFRPDGALNDRAWASAELRAAAAALPGPRWAKARRALLDAQPDLPGPAARRPGGGRAAAGGACRAGGVLARPAGPAGPCGPGAAGVGRGAGGDRQRPAPAVGRRRRGGVRAGGAGAGGGGAGQQRRGVRPRRGADAPGAAPQADAGAAGPEAAVLERAGVRRGAAAGALPVRTPGAGAAQLRPVGPAPDGPRGVGATTVNRKTCGMRQCLPQPRRQGNELAVRKRSEARAPGPARTGARAA